MMASSVESSSIEFIEQSEIGESPSAMADCNISLEVHVGSSISEENCTSTTTNSEESVVQPDTEKIESVHSDNCQWNNSLECDCGADASLSTEEKKDANDKIRELHHNALDNIMSACSTTAQQIKLTINEVLKSRESPSSSSKLVEDVKEKIADFEKTVQQNNICGSNEYRISEVSTLSNEEIILDDCVAISEVSSVELNSHELMPNVKDNESSESVDCENAADLTVNNQSEKAKSEESTPQHDQCTDLKEGEKSPKKLQKTNNGSKKKGERTVEQVMKSLNGYPSLEEKLQALCRKHVEVLDETRSTESRLKHSERYNIQLTKEKEQLQADHNRTVLARSRLESLCRELQRQNKALKEESLLRIREEEEKRKEVASKFQGTLNDISTLMQENSQRNSQLKDENAELAKKLKSLVEHYEMWEMHMEKVVHQRDLESQLAKAKLAKCNLQQKQETETYLKEKQLMLEKMNDLQKRCTDLSANELQLRTELNLYTSKYEEFQGVLNKSNQVFASFKTDMENTTKKIKKLEKETTRWKQKWENSNRALIEMVEDKQKRDQELHNCKQRIELLEKLCRALQAERGDMLNQLKIQSSVSGQLETSAEESAPISEVKDD